MLKPTSTSPQEKLYGETFEDDVRNRGYYANGIGGRVAFQMQKQAIIAENTLSCPIAPPTPFPTSDFDGVQGVDVDLRNTSISLPGIPTLDFSLSPFRGTKVLRSEAAMYYSVNTSVSPDQFDREVMSYTDKTTRTRITDLSGYDGWLLKQNAAQTETVEEGVYDPISGALITTNTVERKKSVPLAYSTGVGKAFGTLGKAAVGAVEMVGAGIANGLVRIGAGVFSIPALLDSVDAAVAVQEGMKDKLGYNLRSDGAIGFGRMVQPLAESFNKDFMNPATLYLESKIGVGATTVLKVGVQSGIEIWGTVAGIRSFGGALESVTNGRVIDGWKGINLTSTIDGPITSRIAAGNLPPTFLGECFVAGTLIATENGLLPIENIRVGDLVCSRNQLTHERSLRRVKQLFSIGDKSIVDVSLRNSAGEVEVISSTTEHPFFIYDGWWKGAADLEVGEKVVLLNGVPAEVVAVEINANRATAYNFEVAEDHTYFVGKFGAWVHNSSKLNWADRAPGSGGANSPSTGGPVRGPDGRFAPSEAGPSIYNRDTQYPNRYRSDVVNDVLDASTITEGPHAGMVMTVDGEIISRTDPRITIEHKQPVVDHWNEIGYDASRAVRNDFFNDTANMGIRLRSANSSDGGRMSSQGIRYRQDVGPNYTR